MAKKDGKKMVLLIIGVGIFVLVAFALLLSFVLMFNTGIPMLGGNVALIRIKGEISNEEALFESNKTAFDIVDELEKAKNDPLVSAVLLEINSAGGTPVATKQITNEILEVKKEKPVVAWISDVGASAGYYVASSASLVIADEDSLTGSIGTISIVPDYSGLLEKLGIGMRVFKSGEMKDMGSPFREMTDKEKEYLQQIVEQAKDDFKEKVIEYRGARLDREKFEKVADGRILTGKQALEVGLIDELGTRKDAIKRAGELAGIENPAIKSYEVKKFSLVDLFSNAGYSFGKSFREGLSKTGFKISS